MGEVKVVIWAIGLVLLISLGMALLIDNKPDLEPFQRYERNGVVTLSVREPATPEQIEAVAKAEGRKEVRVIVVGRRAFHVYKWAVVTIGQIRYPVVEGTSCSVGEPCLSRVF